MKNKSTMFPGVLISLGHTGNLNRLNWVLWALFRKLLRMKARQRACMAFWRVCVFNKISKLVLLGRRYR
jgi:hypothetical protein